MNRIALSLLVASGVLALGLMAAEEKPKRGLDVSGMDISVSPREDFYRYANGTWLKTTEIPASETGWGSNYTLRDDNRKNLRKLLDAAIADRQAATGSLTQRVGDFYASGLDSVAVEKRGYDPVKPYLAEIDAIKSVADLLAYISKHPLEGGWSLLAIGVRQSAQNPDTHTVVMSQTGTGLPEKEYYTKTDDATVKIRQAYVDYITTLFTLTSMPEAKARQQAQDILALEAKLAQSHLSQIEMRNPFPRITKVAVEDFAAGVPALDLSARLTGLGLKTDTLTLFAPKYYRKLAELLGSESLETWKAKLRFSVLSSAALYLSSPFVQASFEFNGKALFGVKVYERWKIISLATDDLMGDLLGQLYVKEYFSPVAKKRMDELVANLRTVFARRIDRLDWMSAETKAEAQKKLAALTTKIGYPSKWKAYEGVTINRNDFYGNLKALAQWRYNEQVSRLGKPVDKTEWNVTPPTVNANYNPLNNEITFPAGILQWPAFDPTADDAINYGAIGTVIGHEMTHGFDYIGRRFIYMGTLKNRWKKEDINSFNKKAQLLIDQYDSYTVLDNLHVKGKLTLYENLADLGGMGIAYEAFKTLTPQGKSSKKIDGFTPDQRFFLTFAQLNRHKIRDEAMRTYINTDTHSPDEFRINGPLSNFEPFYEAFGVKPGDKMYRPDSLRAKIW